MDQTTFHARLAHWKTINERCRSENQSARQRLIDNGIYDKKYYFLPQ